MKNHREVWPDEAKVFLEENYKFRSNIELAILLNEGYERLDKKKFTSTGVAQKLALLKLRRTHKQGMATRKRNHDLKLHRWTGRAKPQLPIGDTIVRTREGAPYLSMKVGPNKFRPAKIVIWEKYHGKLPKGYYVDLIDGDEFNCHKDNLKLEMVLKAAHEDVERLSDNYAASICAKGDPEYRKFLLSPLGMPKLETWKAGQVLARALAEHGIRKPRIYIGAKKSQGELKFIIWPAAAKRYVRMFFRRLSNIELADRLNAKYFPPGSKHSFTPVKIASYRKKNNLRRTKEETAMVKKRNRDNSKKNPKLK